VVRRTLKTPFRSERGSVMLPGIEGFHSGQMKENILRGEQKACYRGRRGAQDFEATVLRYGDFQSKVDLCGEIFSLKSQA
jgi:hypothetical protein